jgi:uncharacterized protein (DUF2236 family)
MDVSRTVNRERIVVLGWGRAILLQLAHPLVAAGIADHSGFAGGPLTRVRRLQATVGAMLDFTFGEPSRVARAAARINGVHRRISGRLRHATGAFPAGTPYSATDPELLLWVHATLLDSVPLAFETFVRPLSTGERDEYCARSSETGRLLGIPADRLPRSARDLDLIVARMRTSGALHVTPDARAIARDLLYPPVVDPTRPAAWLTRLATLGMLPPDIRGEYGFPWNPRHDRAFGAAAAVLRATWTRLPSIVRHWRPGRGEPEEGAQTA